MPRNALFSLVLAASFASVACGGTAPEDSSQQLASQEQSLNAIGQGCSNDDACASNFCFSTLDFMPPYTPWEEGSVCTTECTDDAAGDEFCRQLAAQYNAPRPQYARCLTGWDPSSPVQSQRSLCDLVAAGLGRYWSE